MTTSITDISEEDIDDNGTVSRWTFDDRRDTSTAIDMWGPNDGTINGAVYSRDAPREDSLSMSFDASNEDYISAPLTVFDGTANDGFAISTWINISSMVSNDQVILLDTDSSSHFWMQVDNGRQDIGIGVRDTNDTTYTINSGQIAVESWYNSSIVYEGNSTRVMRGYLNGVQYDSVTLDNDISSDSTGSTYIGSAESNQYFNGEIDDVRIYSRSLSTNEVYELYRWGSMGTDMRSELVTR